MNLKTYTAGSMAEALSEVKKDLGKDAVILHTRVYRAGQVMGMGGRQVVEITASDQAAARAAARPSTRSASPARGVTPSAEPAGFTPKVFPTHAPDAVIEAKPPPAVPAKPTPHPVPMLPDAVPMARHPLGVRVEPNPQNDPAAEAIRDELASIRRLVGQVLHASRRSGSAAASVALSGGLPQPLFDLYTRLQDAGVSAENADMVIARVRDEFKLSELEDPQVARAGVVRQLGAMIPTTGSVPTNGPATQGRPLTIALVGPTGVGKTTTIAKLAASYKLRYAKRVGLVTCDTYRIAAVDQLRTYANIIGLPLKVALTPKELEGACEGLRDCDVILVDTAGRSQHDASRLDELASLVEAARPHETHLVLSASLAEPVMVRTTDRFARLRPDRLVVSKLDEAVQFGPLVNVVRRVGLRIGFVTTGQEVPDHIELASPDRLARLVIDGVLDRGEHGSVTSETAREGLAML